MKKIKGSSSAVKMKYLLFVFAAAVLVALPTRVYQLLALVDASNGFFKESDVTVPVLYGVVVVFSLLFLVLSFISKEVPSPKLPAGKNPVLGIASFIITAGLSWDMLRTLRNIIPVNQGNATIFMSLFKTNLSQNGGTFALLELVFAFFAIIYFLVFGISHLNGKASYKEFKLLALSPLCWSMTVLITKLMNPISFVKVSELLFEIFFFVFVMLFFLTFARISSGVFTEDSMWGIYGYGLTAALLAAIVTIPRIVISLVGLEAVEDYAFDFAHLAVMVFMLAYVFASLGVGFKDGVKNRRAVNDLDLLDDFEAVTKKDGSNDSFEEEETTGVETVEETVNSEEAEAFDLVDDTENTSDIEEKTADTVNAFTISFEETELEKVNESPEEYTEETRDIVDEVSEDITEEVAGESEIAEAVIDEAVIEETVEETEKDEFKVVSLADLKKKKEQE